MNDDSGIPDWAKEAVDQMIFADMMVEMMERYNPKYLPVALEQRTAAIKALTVLMREHGIPVMTDEDVLDDLDI